ncbi:hypothetical protein, partial [Singulisphaera acidiphila]|uniref:hypothetical protein n=1 Tax=Singulisphaera acidiphila TaxID=466153 RepID=UPI0005C74121
KRVGASPASTDPVISFSAAPTYWNGSAFTTAPVANPSAVDLITAEYAAQVLAAGGVTLTAAQAAIQPTLITAASREIIRYCSRQFALTTYTDILTPEGRRQDRGEPASAKLSAFPVQAVLSVLTNRSTVLTIKNHHTSTNQFASVSFAMTGDVEYFDLTYTGLILSRTASGVTTTTTLPFASSLTIQALANAVNALGHGWNATVQSSYRLHPSASLVGAREPKNALANGACLDLFTTPATSYDIDRASGIMRCYGGTSGNGFGPFGDVWGDSLDGSGDFWGWGQYQVTYQAGWATIPENLQQVCAEVVKGMYARLNLNDQVTSMSGGSDSESWSWSARDATQNLPAWAAQTLGDYRSWSV